MARTRDRRRRERGAWRIFKETAKVDERKPAGAHPGVRASAYITVRSIIALCVAITMAWRATNPVRAAGFGVRDAPVITHAHGGFLTGHFEFDVAIVLFVLALMTATFLVIPEDSPKGIGRRAVQGLVITLTVGGVILAVVGFRRLMDGTI